MGLPKRKPTRLRGYDYSTPGAYFITICTQNRECILGNIVGQGLAPAETRLSQYGKIAKDQLLDLENRYKSIKIDKYTIMPNHIHAIFIIENTAGASPCPTISDIICSFKSLTTRICNKSHNKHKKYFKHLFTTILSVAIMIIGKFGNT
ncbi:MAG: transposase [Clostridia bacterium]|nr:transposase [Clostridia bacterium]